MMTIVPLEHLTTFQELKSGSASSSPESALPFQSLFEDAVNNVTDTNAAMNIEVQKLVTGESDDPHAAIIASQKATLSVQLLVELRNKALGAYNELMQTNV